MATQEDRLAYFVKTAKDAIDAMHMIHLAELGGEAVYQPIVERVREQWRCCFDDAPPPLRRVTSIAEAKDAVEEMLRRLEQGDEDAGRYRWLRTQAVAGELESLVALEQLDHLASESRFDTEIDRLRLR